MLLGRRSSALGRLACCCLRLSTALPPSPCRARCRPASIARAQFGAHSCFFGSSVNIWGISGLPWYAGLIMSSVKVLWTGLATLPAYAVAAHGHRRAPRVGDSSHHSSGGDAAASAAAAAAAAATAVAEQLQAEVAQLRARLAAFESAGTLATAQPDLAVAPST